jgi:hypothetical protein
MLNNIAVSHATGTDKSKQNCTEETPEEAEDAEIVALSTAMKIIDLDFADKVKGTIAVPIGKNELPKFMEYLENALANGESLADALTKWSNEKTGFCEESQAYKCRITAGRVIFEESDWLHIDPDTGEIKHVRPPGIHAFLLLRPAGEMREMTAENERDNAAVWDIAADLQKFLRYTFFKQEEDDADEIEKILEYLKLRQEGKCVIRFEEVSRVVWVADFKVNAEIGEFEHMDLM